MWSPEPPGTGSRHIVGQSLESDRDGLICRSAPHIQIVEAAQARQRNQTGVGGWFWLDAPPIWFVLGCSNPETEDPGRASSCPRRVAALRKWAPRA